MSTIDLIALRLAEEWDIPPTPANLGSIKKTWAYNTLALGSAIKALGQTIEDEITGWCVPAGTASAAFNRDQRDHEKRQVTI